MTEQAKIELMMKQDEEMIKKFGFLTHVITGVDNSSPTGFNMHTHGLDRFGHLDFQIVLPVKPEIGHEFFRILVGIIKSGKGKFEDGSISTELMSNSMPVKFIKVQETGREVLRLIFPDRHGNINMDDMDELFAKQYSDGTFLENKVTNIKGPVH